MGNCHFFLEKSHAFMGKAAAIMGNSGNVLGEREKTAQSIHVDYGIVRENIIRFRESLGLSKENFYGKLYPGYQGNTCAGYQSNIETGKDKTTGKAKEANIDIEYLARVAALAGKDMSWFLTPHGEEERADDVAATPAVPPAPPIPKNHSLVLLRAPSTPYMRRANGYAGKFPYLGYSVRDICKALVALSQVVDVRIDWQWMDGGEWAYLNITLIPIQYEAYVDWGKGYNAWDNADDPRATSKLLVWDRRGTDILDFLHDFQKVRETSLEGAMLDSAIQSLMERQSNYSIGAAFERGLSFDKVVRAGDTDIYQNEDGELLGYDIEPIKPNTFHADK